MGSIASIRMAAALPHVDVFASGHSLESLEELTAKADAALSAIEKAMAGA